MLSPIGRVFNNFSSGSSGGFHQSRTIDKPPRDWKAVWERRKLKGIPPRAELRKKRDQSGRIVIERPPEKLFFSSAIRRIQYNKTILKKTRRESNSNLDSNKGYVDGVKFGEDYVAIKTSDINFLKTVGKRKFGLGDSPEAVMEEGIL